MQASTLTSVTSSKDHQTNRSDFNLSSQASPPGAALGSPEPSSPGAPPDPEHQILHPYGVGIDTHSKFIAVCVLYRSSQSIRRTEKSFPADYTGLKAAHAWVLQVLAGLANPDDLRYCIESTSTYHLPVIKAFRGVPTVVNPLLAGATKRKTDVLDAQLLAHHSITGLWKSSFVPSQQGQELRVLWAQRAEYLRAATRAGNRINNIILRFGQTIGSRHSMRSPDAEGLLTELIEGRAPESPLIDPDGLPESIRPIIADLQFKMQEALKAARAAQVTCRNFIHSRDWPTATSPVPGQRLLNHLKTVPGVGEVTAIAWLSEVCDPRRFQNTKQVAAYSGCDPSLKTSAGKVTSFTRRQGNSRLHSHLLNAAAALIRNPQEQLGQLGRSIAGRHKKGGWKKACGALARRIACGLWHVHCKDEPFSYEKYKFMTVPDFKPVAVEDIVGKTAAALLRKEGYHDARHLIAAYFRGRLGTIPGFGQSSLDKIRLWLSQQKSRPVTLDELLAPEPQPNAKRPYRLDPDKSFTRRTTNKKPRKSAKR